MAVGLVSAVCVFGAFAAPALAKKEKEPVIFGKFTASIPGKTISPAEPASTKGHGEVTEIELAKGGLQINHCNKELQSKGKVESESSETFFQNITFSKCFSAVKQPNGFVKQEPVSKFTLGLEFHSNRSVVAGEGEVSEVKVVQPSTVTVKEGKGSAVCTFVIPSQTIPTKAERKPELEYEAASYTTEKVEAPIKKFPSGFQEKLAIEMEFKQVETLEKPTPGCTYGGTVNQEPESPRFGYAEFKNGIMELSLEEISIKNGNVGFEPKK